MQVTIFDSMGFNYVKYEGAPGTGITLRADPDFRSTPVFDYVAVRCGASFAANHMHPKFVWANQGSWLHAQPVAGPVKTLALSCGWSTVPL